MYGFGSGWCRKSWCTRGSTQISRLEQLKKWELWLPVLPFFAPIPRVLESNEFWGLHWRAMCALHLQFMQTMDIQLCSKQVRTRTSQAVESIWEESWSSCLLQSHSPPLHSLCSAFPRQKTACSGDTCEHEKGEGGKQRGRNLFYLTAFHLYPNGAWVICYA